MNSRLSLAFGKSYVRIPLKKSPVIRHADALAIDWVDVIAPAKCSYILGNPPFVGHQWRTKEQQAGMHVVWGREGQVNRLDYVTCWFRKAVEFLGKGSSARIAFVATNSISQGEQASILWSWLYAQGISAFFAHRTFQWTSESRGKAAVHCVIIGLTKDTPAFCTIFDYPDIRGEPVAARVPRINAYLVNAAHILVPTRTQPPVGMPALFQGSKPADGARLKIDGRYVTTSNLIMDDDERAAVLAKEPKLEKWIRPYIGGRELISGETRWCLWLKDAEPEDLAASVVLRERLARVRAGRLQSPTESVREFAATPWLFTQDRQPDQDYLAIPEVSSETREYIPIAMLDAKVIGSNKLLLLPLADKWIFAILTSAMHMGWMRTVSGRLKSDYSYAPTIYNSFPWPELSDARKEDLCASVQAILDARTAHPNATLETLYDADTMPADLRRAHSENDRLVDRLYQRAGFTSERARVEHLFALMEQRLSPLEAEAARPARRRAN